MGLIIAGIHVKYSCSAIVGLAHQALNVRAELYPDIRQRLFGIGIFDKNNVAVCRSRHIPGHQLICLCLFLRLKCHCFFLSRFRLLRFFSLRCFPLLLLLSLRCFLLGFGLGPRGRALVCSSAGTAAAHKKRRAQADHHNDRRILFHHFSSPPLKVLNRISTCTLYRCSSLL